MISLDFQSRAPIYEQLKSRIIELVMLEVFQPDDQLPSVRSLARDLGVNPNTVQKAYQDLEREGIIYSLGGKGSFISGQDSGSQGIRRQALEKFYGVAADCAGIGIEQQELCELLDKIYKTKGVLAE